LTTKRFIEVTAKSTDEALELAKRELKEGEAIAGSEVLQAPARGIFGVVGNPEIRVRFTFEKLPPPPPPPEPVQVRPVPRPASHPAPRTAASIPAARGEHSRPSLVEDEAKDEAKDEAGEADDYDAVNDSDEPTSDINIGEAAGKEEFPARVAEETTGIDVSQDPAWEKLQGLLHEVAENLGIGDVSFQTYPKEGNSVIEVSGENVSQLIGKHGRTLDSLQYIANIIFNNGRDDRAKLILDAQGYRDKRLKNLILLANRMSRKVIDSRRQVELEPMSTLDRRTVHLALKNRAGVETYSRGMEPLRRVVIAPRRGGGGGGYRGRNDRPEQPDRGNSGGRDPEGQDGKSPNKGESQPKSVPMFLEDDGSDES